MARPKAIVDWKKVENYASTGATGTGIAKMLGIAEDTLRRRCRIDNKIGFSEFMQQKREVGFSSIRMKQFSVAMGGNSAMLIWLGKQYLHQTEHGAMAEKVAVQEGLDLKSLTKSELEELERLLQKAEIKK